ncbi:MAG: DUF1446 domain-containing protein [Pseudomonadota bacterium]|nr:DUF1446 domain-containing protein [Pseudomonadota bacterium]
MTSRAIRIGGASGFWGDSGIAAPQLIAGGALDYLVFDYLAEITMSILARARAKDPRAGFARDFVSLVEQHHHDLRDKKIKIISNAGGVNPLACAELLRERLAMRGSPLKVAAILGDDVLGMADSLRERGVSDMFSEAPFPEAALSANAYLGATPIAAALAHGADIVVTGRCVDSAVTLGACIHEFGWTDRDLDALAGGSLAGHIIECGAQASGGIHTDWARTGDWANIGYPIAEVSPDGSFLVSKPPGTGGLVSVGTVSEQLVYEIGDPSAYLLPDVTCDFTQVEIGAAGSNQVRVTGAKGRDPTDFYKVSVTYEDGFRIGMLLTVVGFDAVAKARKVGEAVVRRCEAILEGTQCAPFTEVSLEVIGAEEGFGGVLDRSPREAMIKLAAKHPARSALELLLREFTSTGTSMAPGISGMGGNRPKVSPVIRLFSCLVPKAQIHATVAIDGTKVQVRGARAGGFVHHSEAPLQIAKTRAPLGPFVPLIALAWARSGDKGDNANIGVIARRPEYLSFIRATLTENRVQEVFRHYLDGTVRRFDLPGINGLNFVLQAVLGGGGVASLRNDPQAKSYAQILLHQPIAVPELLATELSGFEP